MEYLEDMIGAQVEKKRRDDVAGYILPKTALSSTSCLSCAVFLGSTPHRVTVTTRIITFLEGDRYKICHCYWAGGRSKAIQSVADDLLPRCILRMPLPAPTSKTNLPCKTAWRQETSDTVWKCKSRWCNFQKGVKLYTWAYCTPNIKMPVEQIFGPLNRTQQSVILPDGFLNAKTSGFKSIDSTQVPSHSPTKKEHHQIFEVESWKFQYTPWN